MTVSHIYFMLLALPTPVAFSCNPLSFPTDGGKSSAYLLVTDFTYRSQKIQESVFIS